MQRYSIIVPVYNRPDHIRQLLECLTKQSYKNFEVIVVESGSSITSETVVQEFNKQLDIKYIFKDNDGQGFSRNRGMKEAKGDFFIIFDSDILIPSDYVEQVNEHLSKEKLDAYGGPDALHPSSSDFQKAVDFCMTSMITTGGTRGRKKYVGKYYPRSFNMGVSRKVYEKVGGFKIPFLGEDIEWSARIIKEGFKTGLIQSATVFHERKSNLRSFFKQLYFFGRARVNISKLVNGSFKITHILPIAYSIFFMFALLSIVTSINEGVVLGILLYLYNFLVLIGATVRHKSFKIGFISVVLVNTLMFSYCMGMVKEFFKLYIFGKKQTYII